MGAWNAESMNVVFQALPRASHSPPNQGIATLETRVTLAVSRLKAAEGVGAGSLLLQGTAAHDDLYCRVPGRDFGPLRKRSRAN